MKKLVILMLALLPITAHADEGMWTIYNLPPAAFEIMKQEGFQMSYNDLYYGDHALKNAVVNFSGYCSGVVVSPN
ncbi:MAG: S46 family peptidase, partial [Prevotella sp.]|nr:S46 family peptidase [Prevotella sp.]